MSPVLALGWIERFDRSVLHWVNCDLHSQGLQDVLFVLQSKEVGVPLVVVLVGLIAALRGRRTALRCLLTCALAYLAGWGLTSLAWTTLQRPRPPRVLVAVGAGTSQAAACASQADAVVTRKHVSRHPGLPSQHATHSAAFAMALFLALRWIGAFAALYALVVAWARVHAGVHWPTDVLAGLALGPLVAWGVWRLLPGALGLLGRRSWVQAEAAGPPRAQDAPG